MSFITREKIVTPNIISVLKERATSSAIGWDIAVILLLSIGIVWLMVKK